MFRERIGRIVEEGRLPRIGRLVSMDLHAELLREGKRHGSACEVRLNTLKGRCVGSTHDVTCVANAGYETRGPELVMPARFAEMVCLLPGLPEGTWSKIYRTTAGPVRVHFVEGGVEVRVLAEDRMSEAVGCGVAISELEDEVLLSDKLISALGIVIEDAGEGFWRFRAEPVERLRRSPSPELW